MRILLTFSLASIATACATGQKPRSYLTSIIFLVDSTSPAVMR